MTRLQLLEQVNELNMQAQPGERFWTCTAMYNTVIWRGGLDYNNERFSHIHAVIPGLPTCSQ